MNPFKWIILTQMIILNKTIQSLTRQKVSTSPSSDGGFYMVYQRENNGIKDIFIKKVDTLEKEFPEIKITSLELGEQINPDIKVLSDDKIIVVFESKTLNIDKYDLDIKGVILNSNLNVYKSDFDIVSSINATVKQQTTPRICTYSTGFIVVYNEIDILNDPSQLNQPQVNVKFQKFDLEGNYINGDLDVNARSDGVGHYNPDCSCVSDGSFWVSWTKKDFTKPYYEINLKAFSSKGVEISTETSISLNNSQYIMYSAINLTSSRKLIIAYSKSSNPQANITSFYYKSYSITSSNSLTLMKLDTLINTGSMEIAINSRLSIIDLANGAFAFIFNCFNRVNESSLGDVCYRAFKTDYMPSQLSEINIFTNTSSFNENNVAGVSLKKGEIALSWDSSSLGMDGKEVYQMIMRGTSCKNVEVFIKFNESSSNSVTILNMESGVSEKKEKLDKIYLKIKSIIGGTNILFNGTTPSIGSIFCLNCLSYTYNYTSTTLVNTESYLSISKFNFTLINADLLESPDECSATIIPCYMSCKTCFSPSDFTNNNCISCESGYFPLSDNTSKCVNSAPPGYFFNKEISQFKPCNIACKSCLSDTVCNECNKGYVIAPTMKSCFNETTKPANFYLKDNNYYPCYNLCSSCSKGGDETSHNCNKCLNNFELQTTGMCIKIFECYQTCNTCSGSGNFDNQKCLTCTSGLYFVEGLYNCVDLNTFPEGYYLNAGSNTLKPCYSSCNSCNETGSIDDHKCQMCKSFYFEQYKTSNCYMLSQSVNKYTFNLEKNMFMPICYTSCESCSFPGNNTLHQCDTCKVEYVFLEDKTNCYLATEKIPNYFYDNLKNQFNRCYDRCDSCNSKGDYNNNLCNVCKPDYLSVISPAKNDSDQIISSGNFTLQNLNCYSFNDIPSGFFYDKYSKILLKCYSSCFNCTEAGTFSSNKCISCNKLFAPKIDDYSNCHSITSDIQGYYYEPSTNLFKTCASGCATCNLSKCMSCKSGYFLTDTGNCNLICYFSCATCNVLGNNRQHKCTSCNKGYIPVSDIAGNCISNYISNPPIGYFYNQINNEFTRCFKTCISCTKVGNEINNNCINCISNFYPLSDNPSNCYDLNSPPKFYYLDNILFTFFPCERPCDECFESIKKYCTNCHQSKMVYYNRECIRECPLNMKSDSFNICRSCHELNLFSFNSTCTEKCPEGYISNLNKLCEKNSISNSTNIDSIKEGCEAYNPCQNHGKCKYEKTSNNTRLYICDCTEFYTGKYCESQVNSTEMINSIQNLKTSGKALNNQMISQISNIVSNSSTNITGELSHKIYELAKDQLQLSLMNNSKKVDETIIKLADSAINIQIKQIKINTVNLFQNNSSLKNESTFLNGGNVNQSGSQQPSLSQSQYIDPILLEENQKKINSIKESLDLVVDKIITSMPQETLSNGSLIKTEMVAIQLFTSSNPPSQREENLSIVNFTNCENTLKFFFYISQELDLIIRKFDFNSETNLYSLNDNFSSDSIHMAFYHPITLEKLNTSLCNESPVEFVMPLKSPKKMNLPLYRELSEKRIDIFDKANPAFISRCEKMVDNTTKADTTINFRRSTYFNGSATCGNGCVYMGVDEFNYMKCSCPGIVEKEMSHTVVDEILDNFPAFNFDIVYCYREAFIYPDLYFNIAFYFSLSSLVLSFIGSLAVYKVNRFVINKCLDKVIINDAKFFNKKSNTISLSDYFLGFDCSKNNSQENSDKFQNFQNLEKTKIFINPYYYHDDEEIFELSAEDRQFLPCHVGNPKSVDDGQPSEEKYKDLPITDRVTDRTIFNEKKTEISSRFYQNLQENQNAFSKSNLNSNNIPNEPSYISDLSRLGISSASHSSRKLLFNVDDDIKNYIMFKQRLDSSFNSTTKQENQFSLNLELTKLQVHKENQNEKYFHRKLTSLEKLSVRKQLSNFALLNKYKSSSNPYIENSRHKITIKDYKQLTIYELALYDRRKFWILYWDLLIEDHILLNVIFKRSIMDPLWIRLIYLVFNLSIMFALNALFFSDDLIDIRATIDESQRNSIFYALGSEFFKTFFSMIFTFIFLFCVDIFRSIPEKYENLLNEALITRKADKVHIAYSIFRQSMMLRYFNFLTVAFLINFFCWYYVIVFCSIYVTSSTGWLDGALVGLLMDWCGLSFIFPMIKALVRYYIRRNPKARFLIIIEYFFWISNFFA